MSIGSNMSTVVAGQPEDRKTLAQFDQQSGLISIREEKNAHSNNNHFQPKLQANPNLNKDLIKVKSPELFKNRSKIKLIHTQKHVSSHFVI